MKSDVVQDQMSHELQDSRQLLSLFVQGRDVPCPACGYNLRNSGSIRCPECGAEIQLEVGPARVRVGFWIVGLLAAALPLGFWLSILTVGGNAILQYWRLGLAYWALGRSDWIVMGIAGGLTVLYSLALWTMMRIRTGWRFRSRRARWTCLLIWITGLLAIHVAGIYALSRVVGYLNYY